MMHPIAILVVVIVLAGLFVIQPAFVSTWGSPRDLKSGTITITGDSYTGNHDTTYYEVTVSYGHATLSTVITCNFYHTGDRVSIWYASGGWTIYGIIPPVVVSAQFAPGC